MMHVLDMPGDTQFVKPLDRTTVDGTLVSYKIKSLVSFLHQVRLDDHVVLRIIHLINELLFMEHLR